jgi:hypothetical protein
VRRRSLTKGNLVTTADGRDGRVHHVARAAHSIPQNVLFGVDIQGKFFVTSACVIANESNAWPKRGLGVRYR